MKTKLVGILNVTPDSFSDGGKFVRPEAAIRRAAQLFHDGAVLVDVGAESTRPHAAALAVEEEWRRLSSILPELLHAYPGQVSLDSYHPETIRRAFDVAPVIINDITGLNNPAMVDLVTTLKPTVIISHLPSTDIQAAHRDEPISRLAAIKQDLLAKARMLEAKGVPRAQIILDPGIGFGKTMALNQQLLRFAEHVPDYQVMIGYSRKRFLGEHRMELATNIEAGKIAIASGAAYLRVHDVAGHARALGLK